MMQGGKPVYGRDWMAEIDFSSIVAGTSLALSAAFPDRQVHTGEIETGAEAGSFQVRMRSAGQVRQLGRRYQWSAVVEVVYSPEHAGMECYDMAHRLCIILQNITTPQGDLIRCTTCAWKVEENELCVSAGYDHTVYEPQMQEGMETLQIRQEG